MGVIEKFLPTCSSSVNLNYLFLNHYHENTIKSKEKIVNCKRIATAVKKFSTKYQQVIQIHRRRIKQFDQMEFVKAISGCFSTGKKNHMISTIDRTCVFDKIQSTYMIKLSQKVK